MGNFINFININFQLFYNNDKLIIIIDYKLYYKKRNLYFINKFDRFI